MVQFAIVLISALTGCKSSIDSINGQAPCSEKSVHISSKLQLLLKELETNKNNSFDSYIKKDGNDGIVDLCLASNMASDENMNELSTLPFVAKITLSCCANNTTPLTAHSFGVLKKFKSLKHLTLYGAVDKLSIEMCKSIASINRLESLTIEYSIVPEESVKFLKQMHIKSLQISESCTVEK